jgi:Fur family transcriptional regulator, ferric uptake regulator
MTGRRNTRQRETILETLTRAEGPLRIEDILERSRDELPSLGLATVYRTVALLKEEQRINEVQLPGEEPRFELPRLQHHHHFRCEHCGRVFELDFCPVHLPTGALLPNGFRVSSHHLTLYGTCNNCDHTPAG